MTIQEIHNNIYTHLRANYPNLRFRLRQDIPRNWQKLLDGYWFWGDSNSIQISFWNGSDKDEKTYMISWRWLFKYSYADVSLVGRDDRKKAEYFKDVVSFLQNTDNDDLRFEQDKSKPIWRHIIEEKDYIKSLDYFITAISPKINQYIINNDPLLLGETGKSFDFSISEKYFQKSIAATETYRAKTNIYTSEKEPHKLPYSLKRISVSRFQGIEDLKLENLPSSANWIFITGENGFGKTSLLKAIAVGLVGFDATYLGKSDIQMAFNTEGGDIVKHRVTGSEYDEPNDTVDDLDTEDILEDMKTPSSSTIPPVALYGVTRISNKYSTILPSNVTQSLFDNEAVFYDIQNELKIIEKRDKKRFELLKEAFKTIIPTLEDISVDKKGEFVYYKEIDNTEKVTLDKLGAGLQGTINLVGDIIKRLENHPVNQKAKSLNDLKGIVLIDEIDANLHPKYQYQIPQLLSAVFEKVQFITITHSPIPLLGAMKFNPIVLTVQRDKDKGIQIERWDDKIDLEVLMPNAILTSPIFNFETLFSSAFDEKIERIRTENFYDDVVYHDRLKKDVNSLVHVEDEDELIGFFKSKMATNKK